MEVKIKYENIFEIISKSQDVIDFVSNVTDISIVTIEELNRRLDKCLFPFKVVKIIDDMQEEISSLMDNINSVQIVENQPYVSSAFFLLIIQFNNPELFKDYIYNKYIVLN